MKKTTKSTAAKKTASQKALPEPEPMDSSTIEHAVGSAAVNTGRVCYALKTLVDEVHELFPETPVEYSDYDGRPAAHGAQFDTTVINVPEDRDMFVALLELTSTDERVEEVIYEEDIVLVAIIRNPRLQDSRDSFGLREAFDIITSDEGLDGSLDGEDDSL